jgi:uncharacterized membrane protein YcgQ (UPF0703/DUF1980 family)
MAVNPPSLDIIELLLKEKVIEHGFVGSEAIDFDETFVTAIDVGGSSNPKWLRDDNRIHFRVKSKRNSYLEGWNTSQKIKEFLLGKEPIKINNVYYIRFVMSLDTYLVYYDENNRPVFALEIEITREYDAPLGNRQEIC